jgi:hypothetical protein
MILFLQSIVICRFAPELLFMRLYSQLKWVIACIAISFTIHTTNAQLCTPDPAYTNGGVYPDTTTNLATGCVGDFYVQVFTIVVPADTTVAGFTVPINYLMIDSITGLIRATLQHVLIREILRDVSRYMGIQPYQVFLILLFIFMGR